VRWPHVTLSSVLALGAAGLILGAAWISTVPTYLCDEGVPSPNWIYAGFILFAFCLPASILLGTLLLLPDTVHRIYIAVAVGEAVAALALAMYLGSKYGHYQCG
jgi:hypothetical protein